MVGADVAKVLRLAGIRDEIVAQHQRNDLTVAEFGLRSRFALEQFDAFLLIPVIDQDENIVKRSFMDILVMGMSPRRFG